MRSEQGRARNSLQPTIRSKQHLAGVQRKHSFGGHHYQILLRCKEKKVLIAPTVKDDAGVALAELTDLYAICLVKSQWRLEW